MAKNGPLMKCYQLPEAVALREEPAWKLKEHTAGTPLTLSLSSLSEDVTRGDPFHTFQILEKKMEPDCLPMEH